MKNLAAQKTPGYVIIGHITQDLTPQGKIPGGTALYAGWTAHTLGMKVGFFTSVSSDFSPPLPTSSVVINEKTETTSTFENIQTGSGRVQYIHQRASSLQPSHLPDPWKNANIVHLGPIADEIELKDFEVSPKTLLCVTLQGWLRRWDEKGKISYTPLHVSEKLLARVDLAVVSIEDVKYKEAEVDELVSVFDVLVVTEGALGSRVYWHGDQRHILAPRAVEKDSTGAGDIFAAAFFCRYSHTRDPWEAARFATNLASNSVARYGLDSIPTNEEIQEILVEIIKNS